MQVFTIIANTCLNTARIYFELSERIRPGLPYTYTSDKPESSIRDSTL